MRSLALLIVGPLVVSLAGCSGTDPNLETLEYAISMISLDGPATARIVAVNRVEVEGRATNHDRFQHDVYFTATLWDSGGKAIGTATGKLEDWPAGHHGVYQLVGAAPSGAWTRVSVVVSNVTEHVRGRPE